MLAAQDLPDEVREGVNAIQHDLFDLGWRTLCPGLEGDRKAPSAAWRPGSTG
ncbi:hypothetical protein [Thiohalobacter thiocyanaticus]|uniref:hypothetical protein n=1 Tax=Thiohalobacter thiocyanaticus TaxID=585455 RepID=UPI00131A0AD0|nr:hypothetical protein [Thiohalobacter thiocyanaticus]